MSLADSVPLGHTDKLVVRPNNEKAVRERKREEERKGKEESEIHDMYAEAERLAIEREKRRLQLSHNSSLGSLDLSPVPPLAPVAIVKPIHTSISHLEEGVAVSVVDAAIPAVGGAEGVGFTIEVDIGNGIIEKLSVYPDSNPEQLALNFILLHKLPNSHLAPLIQYIHQLQEEEENEIKQTSSFSSSQHYEAICIDIDIGDGTFQPLEIYIDSNPHEAAKAFLLEFQLSSDYYEPLVSYIIETQKSLEPICDMTKENLNQDFHDQTSIEPSNDVFLEPVRISNNPYNENSKEFEQQEGEKERYDVDDEDEEYSIPSISYFQSPLLDRSTPISSHLSPPAAPPPPLPLSPFTAVGRTESWRSFDGASSGRGRSFSVPSALVVCSFFLIFCFCSHCFSFFF